MSTIKLNKQPNTTPATGKTPLRRPANHLRDRSKAPVKPVLARPEESVVATEKRPVRRDNEIKAPSESTRQRNHRHDGRLHAESRHVRRHNPEEPHYRQSPTRGGKARDGYDPTAARAAKPDVKSSSPETFPRLSKLMSELGLCSRREADEWIANGWVKVNGEVMSELGVRVSPDARIEVDREAKTHQAEQVTILLHKPVGYVSGQAEDGYQPAVVLLHPDNQWPDDPLIDKRFKRGYLAGLAPAGRLDIDSTGLLVFTQDGRVARQLIGEDSTVEKEYLVRVTGELSDEGLRLLNHGLRLDGVQLKPAKVSWQNEDQLRFVLREGRKRQIRRMCELVGLHVTGLKRVRIGSVTLGKLPPGQWRYLRPEERF